MLRFKTCRLLSGNVRNRELTIIQRRILRRLRNKKRSIKRKIYPRENLNSYIKSIWTKERQLLLMEFLSNSIPALISFCFVSLLGLPFFCFCDSEDRDGGDKTGAGPQEEGPSASAAGPSSRVEGLNRFPDIRERERELVGEDFSPSDSDSDRPDPEASPSGNAQSEPYTFHFGERLPDLNLEAPTLHEDPSEQEIRRCIEEEASLSESELPPTDGVAEDLRSLLLGKRKLPDLNEALSEETEEEKEALVSRIHQKASEYLRIRETLTSNVRRKLKNRATFAQCETFLRQIPGFLSDKEKAREESDVDYDE